MFQLSLLFSTRNYTWKWVGNVVREKGGFLLLKHLPKKCFHVEMMT
jgi:hypothetical protein